MIGDALVAGDADKQFTAISVDFATFQESRIKSPSPTTVLCFDPYVKSTISDKHNIKKQQSITVMPGTWSEYQNEAFFHMGKQGQEEGQVLEQTLTISSIRLYIQFMQLPSRNEIFVNVY